MELNLNMSPVEFSFPKNNISLFFQAGHYDIKTINTFDEFREVLKLRYDVFFREFAGNSTEEEGLDMDDHDFLCDHLIVKDRRESKIVACYRLLSSTNKPQDKKFYSEGEFIIDEFISTPDIKLELGRACVHRDYRKGTVILLLWRGLMEYASKCEAKYMFGCSSIQNIHFEHIPEILKEIENQKAFISEWPVVIDKKYAELPDSNTFIKADRPKSIHSLMQMYISAGAKVSRQMAYDKEMDCMDLLTILDLENLPVIYKSKFG